MAARPLRMLLKRLAHLGAGSKTGKSLQPIPVRKTPNINQYAKRMDPASDVSPLILPDELKQQLHQITGHVRQQQIDRRALGVCVLFIGENIPGRTMATRVLAKELQRDLYCVDLSRVVSKYIGETEKNLQKLFDAAQETSAILLFDQADDLFGKRTEVDDTRDRYANIEISYLLQRMENFSGVAILTINSKTTAYETYLRRIQYVIHLPTLEK